LAAARGNTLQLAAIRARLSLYKENKPYRNERPSGVAQSSKAGLSSSRGNP